MLCKGHRLIVVKTSRASPLIGATMHYTVRPGEEVLPSHIKKLTVLRGNGSSLRDLCNLEECTHVYLARCPRLLSLGKLRTAEKVNILGSAVQSLGALETCDSLVLAGVSLRDWGSLCMLRELVYTSVRSGLDLLPSAHVRGSLYLGGNGVVTTLENLLSVGSVYFSESSALRSVGSTLQSGTLRSHLGSDTVVGTRSILSSLSTLGVRDLVGVRSYYSHNPLALRYIDERLS